MTNKDVNNWIMYHEIHKLSRMGFSNAKIGRYLVLDARTVKRILSMTEEQYELQLLSAQTRTKILSAYEPFVRQRLETFHDTPAAQMHDWLKEQYPAMEKVSSRTVFNFVMYVRQKYNIPISKVSRQYFPIDELPYGMQAQVDFGSYNMRMSSGGQKKIHFFAMVLSRSRMKYICFTDKPFTSQSVCQAHENAFQFFNGIPEEIVYDQDRTLIVDENMGNIILTTIFKQYTRSRNFALHFCRKADPESKGKIENVIRYVKKNFLFNRTYIDVETLNNQAIAWLGRTANALEHNYTKKIPQSVFEKEKPFLKHFTPMIVDNKNSKLYHVRKTNTIAYKSNFYSLPTGTYKGTGTQVCVKENDGVLEISNADQSLICTHTICSQTGQTIINNNHKRDTSKSLREMTEETVACFQDQQSAREYIHTVNKQYPRYLRDHLQTLLKTVAETKATPAETDKALAFCSSNHLFSGYDFSQVLYLVLDNKTATTSRKLKLLDRNNLKKATQAPEKSNIEVYENIINQ